MKTNKKLRNTVITLSSILSLSLLGVGFLASLNQASLNADLPFNEKAEVYSEEIDYSTKKSQPYLKIHYILMKMANYLLLEKILLAN